MMTPTLAAGLSKEEDWTPGYEGDALDGAERILQASMGPQSRDCGKAGPSAWHVRAAERGCERLAVMLARAVTGAGTVFANRCRCIALRRASGRWVLQRASPLARDLTLRIAKELHRLSIENLTRPGRLRDTGVTVHGLNHTDRHIFPET